MIEKVKYLVTALSLAVKAEDKTLVEFLSKELTGALSPTAYNVSESQVNEAVMHTYRTTGSRINAIKTYRILTGANLIDSKNSVNVITGWTS